MSDEFDIRPKRGRLGDQGSLRPKRISLNPSRHALRKNSPAGKSKSHGFTGQRLGSGAGHGALSKTRQFGRSRRAIVKVYIAKAGPGGTGGFAKHVSYIQRDGTERDGTASQIYDRTSDKADTQAFNERALEDVRQFRLILSAEDGHELNDLKDITRAFMSGVERDLGQQLDWIAGDHHNTDHPHSHIVIRGRQKGNEIIIAKDYITHGFRARARDVLTHELGLRRERDVTRAQMRATTRNGWTSIDRALDTNAENNRLSLTPTQGAHARLGRSIYLNRLTLLRSMGLAKQVDGEWILDRDWKDVLRALERRGDIIRSLAQQFSESSDHLKIQDLTNQKLKTTPLLGTFLTDLPGDELRNSRTAIIRGFDHTLWSLNISERAALDLPSKGAIVEISKGAQALRTGEHTSQTIKTSQAAPALTTLSWLSLDELITHHDAGWLDHMPDHISALSETLSAARKKRLAWLRTEGLLSPSESRLSPAQLRYMQREALSRALKTEASKLSVSPATLLNSGEFTGQYTGHVDLPQGRFIRLTNKTSLALAPWRAGLGPLRGQRLSVSRKGQTLNWQLARSRGRSR